MNKLITLTIVSWLGGSTHVESFQPPKSPAFPVSSTFATLSQRQPLRQSSLSPSSLQLSPIDLVLDPSFLAGSVLWGVNFYFGFDWILAPLGTGLDSDFNAAYRTATVLGSLAAGKSPTEALSAVITDDEGDRPEMGSRIGSGANVGYLVAVENDEVENADWLSDREAGLRSSAPLPLQFLVFTLYLLVGFLAMAISNSVQTAAVFAIPALVYEIGRPSLPTREEAIFDSKLDKAVNAFANERMLIYGQEILPEGVVPVKRDEAANERELVGAFRREWLQRGDAPFQNQDVSDFQIEMRFREIGTGRSEGGFIKGVRLLREPVSWQ